MWRGVRSVWGLVATLSYTPHIGAGFSVPDTMSLDNKCMHIVNLAYLSKDAGRAAEAPLDWSHEEAIS